MNTIDTTHETQHLKFINLTDANSGYLVRILHNGTPVEVFFKRVGLSTNSVIQDGVTPELAAFAQKELDRFHASGL